VGQHRKPPFDECSLTSETISVTEIAKRLLGREYQ
jgi:hypothetical protein